MKITIEHCENEYSFTIEDDVTFDDLLDKTMDLFEFIGYHKETIKRNIIELAEGYEQGNI